MGIRKQVGAKLQRYKRLSADGGSASLHSHEFCELLVKAHDVVDEPSP